MKTYFILFIKSRGFLSLILNDFWRLSPNPLADRWYTFSIFLKIEKFKIATSNMRKTMLWCIFYELFYKNSKLPPATWEKLCCGVYFMNCSINIQNCHQPHEKNYVVVYILWTILWVHLTISKYNIQDQAKYYYFKLSSSESRLHEHHDLSTLPTFPLYFGLSGQVTIHIQWLRLTASIFKHWFCKMLNFSSWFVVGFEIIS